ncbi:MAG: ABC transporter permease [Phycisphaerae bacterium]|nr:ABC transporter permease [Phycisphaerae bacterium]
MALPLYYNWRNLFVRKLSTMLTFAVVAVIVLVLAVLLSFAAGIRASLASSGSRSNIMVLKPGATAESTSIILPDEISKLVQAPHVARGGDGRPLVSEELCVQTSIPRSTDGTLANVAVRGVAPVAFDVHREVRLIEGRRFDDGALEVIVGKAARDRYANLQIGGEVPLGKLSNRTYRVVGVFEAGGGALESEIWAGLTSIRDSFDRRFSSSAVLALDDAVRADETIAAINGPSIQLEARRESDYYIELSRKTREIVLLTSILIGIMSIGAVFAVANTMYASVDGRRREIAMLRTIGFSRGAILTAFLIESMLICVVACAAGIGGSLLLSGSRQDFLSDTTWTVLAYELRITGDIVVSALGLAVVVGAVGALAPALRASRIRVIEALRKA